MGMIVGAAAGAVTALLYAPKPGTEVRHHIKSGAREAGRKAGEAWGGVKERTSAMARTARERTRGAVRAGRRAAEEKRKELEAELEEKERKAEGT